MFVVCFDILKGENNLLIFWVNKFVLESSQLNDTVFGIRKKNNMLPVPYWLF